MQILSETVYGSGTISSISTRETTNCADRNIPGLICESCSRVATCVLIKNQWKTILVADCNSDVGLYCNIREGGCSNKTGPCHPYGIEGNFNCNQDGVFPDPYDCQKYHMCYRFNGAYVDLSVNCSSDKAFNPATGDCSASLSDSICRVTQFTCDRLGETAAWPGNSNIFYVCILRDDTNTFSPSIYRCGAGEIFDGVNCKAIDYAALVASTTRSTVNNVMLGAKFQCSGPGLFPDQERCDTYYVCNSLLNYSAHQCPENTYFNRRMKACDVGECIYNLSQ